MQIKCKNGDYVTFLIGNKVEIEKKAQAFENHDGSETEDTIRGTE